MLATGREAAAAAAGAGAKAVPFGAPFQPGVVVVAVVAEDRGGKLAKSPAPGVEAAALSFGNGDICIGTAPPGVASGVGATNPGAAAAALGNEKAGWGAPGVPPPPPPRALAPPPPPRAALEEDLIAGVTMGVPATNAPPGEGVASERPLRPKPRKAKG